MIRMLGAVLVAAGCACLGFRAAAELGGRTRALGAALSGLELLERELVFSAPPLPQLMDSAARRIQGPVGELFDQCAQGLGQLDETPFCQVWSRAVEGCDQLGEQGREVLRPVGQVLGRYEAQEQQQALRRAQEELKSLLERTRDDGRRLGRVYRALGLSGGAFLVILLL